jgi:hypothetical protein
MKKLDIAKDATRAGLAQDALPIVQLLAKNAMEVEYV